MDFSNIQILDKGVTRTGGNRTAKEANFDIRFTHYSRQTKNGTDLVKHFVFSKKAMVNTKLESAEFAASPFLDATNGVAGIIVLPAAKGEFFVPSKRSPNGKKASNVTVPNLVNALVQTGELNLEFQGSQHFDLVEVGSEGDMVAYKVVKSTTVEDKAYVAGEESEDEEIGDANGADQGNY